MCGLGEANSTYRNARSEITGPMLPANSGSASMRLLSLEHVTLPFHARHS